jgi:hypothetical protein
MRVWNPVSGWRKKSEWVGVHEQSVKENIWASKVK